MSEGEFEKRCVNLQKTFCIHTPIEDENGEITQKVHEAYRNPTSEEIKNVLDEARKEFPAKFTRQGLDMTVLTTPNPTHDQKKLIEIFEWFLKWLGDST